jgi:hypothetical protein
MSARRTIVAALVVGALALMAVGVALAKPTLTVTPDPVALDGTFTVAGCGYPEGSSISFEVTGPRKSGIHYFTAASPVAVGGCYGPTEWLAWWGVTGDYQLTSWYRDSKGSTHKAAVVKFTVTE